MARAVYVDTSRTADGKRKKRMSHYVYDGEKVFEVNKLTKLKNVDEVFIDSLFPEIYEEVLELLKRGIKVYLLKDTRILKKLRLENNLKKSDESDAVLLSKISKDSFRALIIQEMELKATMRPLINRYEWIAQRKKVLKQWIATNFNYNFDNSIRLIEHDGEMIGREILKKIQECSPYKDIYKNMR